MVKKNDNCGSEPGSALPLSEVPDDFETDPAFVPIIEQMRFDWMYDAGLFLGGLVLLVGAIACWQLEVVYIPPGQCENCRYDLSGSTTGKCPECGHLNSLPPGSLR